MDKFLQSTDINYINIILGKLITNGKFFNLVELRNNENKQSTLLLYALKEGNYVLALQILQIIFSMLDRSDAKLLIKKYINHIHIDGIPAIFHAYNNYYENKTNPISKQIFYMLLENSKNLDINLNESYLNGITLLHYISSKPIISESGLILFTELLELGVNFNVRTYTGMHMLNYLFEVYTYLLQVDLSLNTTEPTPQNQNEELLINNDNETILLFEHFIDCLIQLRDINNINIKESYIIDTPYAVKIAILHQKIYLPLSVSMFIRKYANIIYHQNLPESEDTKNKIYYHEFIQLLRIEINKMKMKKVIISNNMFPVNFELLLDMGLINKKDVDINIHINVYIINGLFRKAAILINDIPELDIIELEYSSFSRGIIASKYAYPIENENNKYIIIDFEYLINAIIHNINKIKWIYRHDNPFYMLSAESFNELDPRILSAFVYSMEYLHIPIIKDLFLRFVTIKYKDIISLLSSKEGGHIHHYIGLLSSIDDNNIYNILKFIDDNCTILERDRSPIIKWNVIDPNYTILYNYNKRTILFNYLSDLLYEKLEFHNITELIINLLLKIVKSDTFDRVYHSNPNIINKKLKLINHDEERPEEFLGNIFSLLLSNFDYSEKIEEILLECLKLNVSTDEYIDTIDMITYAESKNYKKLILMLASIQLDANDVYLKQLNEFNIKNPDKVKCNNETTHITHDDFEKDSNGNVPIQDKIIIPSYNSFGEMTHYNCFYPEEIYELYMHALSTSTFSLVKNPFTSKAFTKNEITYIYHFIKDSIHNPKMLEDIKNRQNITNDDINIYVKNVSSWKLKIFLKNMLSAI